jgi:serine O-acetyltransferase
VQTPDSGVPNAHGVDLNHHLIPDPVAGAISCLLDRIRLLEETLGKGGCLPGGEHVEDECYDCDARDVCDDHDIRHPAAAHATEMSN